MVCRISKRRHSCQQCFGVHACPCGLSSGHCAGSSSSDAGFFLYRGAFLSVGCPRRGSAFSRRLRPTCHVSRTSFATKRRVDSSIPAERSRFRSTRGPSPRTFFWHATTSKRVPIPQPNHDYGRLSTNSLGYPSREFVRARRQGISRVVLSRRLLCSGVGAAGRELRERHREAAPRRRNLQLRLVVPRSERLPHTS